MRMEGIFVCDVCGNKVDSRASQCPFCRATRSLLPQKSEVLPYKVINLEKGMPIVPDALKYLHNELGASRMLGYRVLFVIHGYGSSGKGGVIRTEVRRQLQYLYDRSEINDFLPGEDCVKRSGRFSQMARRFPFITGLVGKPNPGVTFVIL